jgi:hypothetical protein
MLCKPLCILISLALCVVTPRLGNGEEPTVKPLDPVEQARRAMAGFMTKTPLRLPGAEGHYRAMFDSVLVPVPKCGHAHDGAWFERWDLGDCTGRAVLAWTALREMTGDQTTGLDVEQGQRKFLLSLLHPQTGLVWYNADAKTGTYRYHIWDQSRTLRALVCWFQSKPDDRDRLRPLIERMIHELDSRATIRGEDAVWGPYAGLPSDEYIDATPEAAFTGYFVNNRAGVCIEPLVDYARATGDAKILDIAVRFANCEMSGHQGDIVSAEQKPYFQFGENGSFVGQFHTKAGTLIGMAKLARLLAAQGRVQESQRYLRAVRKSYDWIFAADNPGRGSRIGWIPESPGGPYHETCCATDMVELAATLASCDSIAPEFRDWVNLHDDVEAIAVNTISRAQVRFTPDFEKTLAGFYGENASTYMETARRFDGAWLANLSPNEILLSENGKPYVCIAGCCQYSGASGWCAGWRDAMTHDRGVLRINYFLKRESSQATMTTTMPVDGQADITLREAVDVQIRVPTWLKAEQIVVQVDGKNVNAAERLDPGRHWIALGKLAVGAKIAVRFPVENRETEEHMANQKLTIRWRGNYVVQIRPRTAKLPIFP